MAVLRFKDITKMNEKEREEKLAELKLQLVKIAASNKNGKTKEIKRAVSRILTFNTSQKKEVLKTN
jgi:ribosomal protein L29